MLVRDAMTTPVVTATGDTPVREARRLMQQGGFHRLPVLHGEQLVGIVTARHLRRYQPVPGSPLAVWEEPALLDDLPIAAVMEREVVTTTADSSVEAAVELARAHGVGALPVLDRGRLVGIVTVTDLFRLLAGLLRVPRGHVQLRVKPAEPAAHTIARLLARLDYPVFSLFTWTDRSGATELYVCLPAAAGERLAGDLERDGLTVRR